MYVRFFVEIKDDWNSTEHTSPYKYACSRLCQYRVQYGISIQRNIVCIRTRNWYDGGRFHMNTKWWWKMSSQYVFRAVCHNEFHTVCGFSFTYFFFLRPRAHFFPLERPPKYKERGRKNFPLKKVDAFLRPLISDKISIPSDLRR